MRLFSVSTPKSSPELVRHSLVSRQQSAGSGAESHHSMPDRPAGNSPGLVRGVSTLGRKVSRRFEKFGESETARRLRMASPSRKYQWAIAGDASSPPTASLAMSDDGSSKSPKQKSRVSRVDSFRNFFSLAQPSSSSASSSSNHASSTSASTLRTPRAVKRRSKNGGERRSARLQLVDAATCTNEEMSAARMHNLSAPNSLSNGLNSRFGSSSAELALIMAGRGAGDGFSELSECQSEADLRYYNYCTTEDEDDNSVASEGFLRSSLLRSNSKSAGNLRLGMVPENRTVCNYPDRSSAVQIKDYGMIDSSVARKDGDPGGGKNSNESGYSSSDNNSNGTSPNSSSRASPRASLDGEQEQQQQSASAAAAAALAAAKEAKSPPHSLAVPPKKPARTSKLNASRSRSLEQAAVTSVSAVSVASKDYKMVRLAKRSLSDELGIIIAKKKLKEINTTGFQIVHIEPGGMVDR